MKIMQSISVFIISVLFAHVLNAATPSLNFNNLRKMAMGDAGVAISNDDSALYVNPAGLARVKTIQIKSPRLQIKAGSEFIDRYDQIASILSGKTVDIAELNQLLGMDGTAGIQFSPLVSIAAPGFGFSLLAGYDMTLKLNYDASLSAFGNKDSAIALGLADEVSLWHLPVAFGVSIKSVYRQVLYDRVTGQSQIDLESGDVIDRINSKTLGDAFQEFGIFGVGVDLGLLSSTTWASIPITVGAAVRNIGATLAGEKPLKTGSTPTTLSLPVETVIGASATPTLPLIGDTIVAFDYTLSPSNALYNSLHFGVEKKCWDNRIQIRGGINQGYITGGIGTDLGIIKLDYAYFTRERGATAGSEPDSMHVLEIGWFL